MLKYNYINYNTFFITLLIAIFIKYITTKEKVILIKK